MDLSKPYSQACENNKEAILTVLKKELRNAYRVLEVGSGTGQHAVYFSEQMPQLDWQTADRLEYHAGINQWLQAAQHANFRQPIALDVGSYDWASAQYDAVFCANTLHIMGLDQVKGFVRRVGEALSEKGRFLVYGPFNYAGKYTSASNARFDQWLKQQDVESAIRDFEQVNSLANEGGLVLREDYTMPANNRLLVWEKQSES